MRTGLLLGVVLAVCAVVWIVSPDVRWIRDRFFVPERDLSEIRARVVPALQVNLSERGMEWGAPIFIRVFKEEAELEVWLQNGEGFELFQTYPICTYSGELGPKQKEGDRQSPEGFYSVGKSAMNPNSNYHLSFNLGFPNAYDQGQGRTGSFLMVHGKCASIGCYAMTDAGIEEIYLLAEAALEAGQAAFPVHAFPFRMTNERLALEQGSQWYPFWSNLKDGYDAFEKERTPPLVSVEQGAYVFEIG